MNTKRWVITDRYVHQSKEQVQKRGVTRLAVVVGRI